jgi:hypothetical protein
LISIALAPATTFRKPSANIAWARIVEVLVPSPTISPVFSAASRNIRAPKIFFRIRQVDLFGDSHTVVANQRGAPFFLDENRFRSWSQRNPHSICELSGPPQDLFSRLRTEQYLFVRHEA